jgi:uncharacterized membrane protein
MPWLLALSYWIHLLATIIWLGGIALITLLAWPALQRGTLAANQWWSMQRKFVPWANASMILLLVTGFYQMTTDGNYTGFLSIDSTWAVVILLKHIAFLAMVVIAVYMQAILYPALSRMALLAKQRPQTAADKSAQFQTREIRLLQLNLICAVVVLLFTALATAL